MCFLLRALDLFQLRPCWPLRWCFIFLCRAKWVQRANLELQETEDPPADQERGANRWGFLSYHHSHQRKSWENFLEKSQNGQETQFYCSLLKVRLLCSGFVFAAGNERRSREWRSHGTRRPAGTCRTSRSSWFTCHRWEPCSHFEISHFEQDVLSSERRFWECLIHGAAQQSENQQQQFYLATEKLDLGRRNTTLWLWYHAPNRIHRCQSSVNI